MGCDPGAEILGRCDGARVVDSGGFVEFADISGARLSDTLLEAVAGGGASCSVGDHLGDCASWARVLDGAIVTCSTSVMRLHEAWISDSVVGGRGADTAI